MKVGLYPGSFNPWHVGHQDILNKALKVFDTVIVLMCQNPEKIQTKDFEAKFSRLQESVQLNNTTGSRPVIDKWQGTILSYLEDIKKRCPDWEVVAMVRGLRNGYDLEYEIAQQGLHEDTGNHLPFACFLTDRKYGHVSSSAVRALDKLGLKHGYTC